MTDSNYSIEEMVLRHPHSAQNSTGYCKGGWNNGAVVKQIMIQPMLDVQKTAGSPGVGKTSRQGWQQGGKHSKLLSSENLAIE